MRGEGARCGCQVRQPATNGGDIAYQIAAPTRAAADERLAAPFNADANDYIYAWESSASYNPTPGLPKITAPLLAINAPDEERNPPITGLTEQAIGKIKGAYPVEPGESRPWQRRAGEAVCEGARGFASGGAEEGGGVGSLSSAQACCSGAGPERTKLWILAE